MVCWEGKELLGEKKGCWGGLEENGDLGEEQ